MTWSVFRLPLYYYCSCCTPFVRKNMAASRETNGESRPLLSLDPEESHPEREI